MGRWCFSRVDGVQFVELVYWGADLVMRIAIFLGAVVLFGGNLFVISAGVFWLFYGLVRSLRELKSLDALRQAFGGER